MSLLHHQLLSGCSLCFQRFNQSDKKIFSDHYSHTLILPHWLLSTNSVMSISLTYFKEFLEKTTLHTHKIYIWIPKVSNKVDLTNRRPAILWWFFQRYGGYEGWPLSSAVSKNTTEGRQWPDSNHWISVSGLRLNEFNIISKKIVKEKVPLFFKTHSNTAYSHLTSTACSRTSLV